MSKDNTYSQFVRKRALVKVRLTNLNKYLESVEKIELNSFSSIQIKELQKRYDVCQELNSEFNIIQSNIEGECCDDSELETQINERECFEEKIIHMHRRDSTYVRNNVTWCNK